MIKECLLPNYGAIIYLCVSVCLCVKEKFRDFCSSPNIMKVMSRTMRRTSHVARTGGEVKFIQGFGGKIGKE